MADPRTDKFAVSDAYEQFMGRWSRRLAREFVAFAGVTTGDSILDVGAGTGSLTLTLAAAVPEAHITGVDRSAAYLALARSRASSGRVRFEIGDAMALEHPDATFDAALSMLVLNFVPEPARAIREMIRVTRPGGTIAVAVWDYSGGMDMLCVFWEEARALDPAAARPDEHRLPLCREGELREALVDAGLTQVDQQALTIELPFTSFNDYWMPFLGGQGPAGVYVRTLDQELRDRLAARLRARLLRGANDGAFSLHARAWAARATIPSARTQASPGSSRCSEN
jgi:SAM-dependent methyltransferase